MGHRRQERAHMSQREQREGHRRQEKLHMSSQCHRNVLPIFFNDKNYRLFGEYLTNTLWGVYYKCENNAIRGSIMSPDIINFYASFET